MRQRPHSCLLHSSQLVGQCLTPTDCRPFNSEESILGINDMMNRIKFGSVSGFGLLEAADDTLLLYTAQITTS